MMGSHLPIKIPKFRARGLQRFANASGIVRPLQRYTDKTSDFVRYCVYALAVCRGCLLPSAAHYGVLAVPPAFAEVCTEGNSAVGRPKSSCFY